MNRLQYYLFGSILFLGVAVSCDSPPSDQTIQSGLKRENFRTIVNGDSVDLFVIHNNNGMEVCITNYGGRVVSMLVPDRKRVLQDVVLGFDHIDDYLAQPSSFGATMGRVTNRIGYGKFPLDGDTIQVDRNNGQHTIHGGAAGWRQQVFDPQQPNDSTLILSYLSPDGEAGFPGNVKAQVQYTVTSNNALKIEYSAQTDKTTIVNLTNHSFFNLSGHADHSVLDDTLYVNAQYFTPIDTALITTGEIRSVANSPFDFNTPIRIRDAIASDSTNQQLSLVEGLDHNWVLNTSGSPKTLAAKVLSPISGIVLEVYTDEPGIQVYTGNSLDGSQKGKGGQPFQKQSAICLETQHYPDAPNKPMWPSTVLKPGDTYRSTCIYQFSTL